MPPATGVRPQLAIVPENAPLNHLVFTGEGAPAGVHFFDRAVLQRVLPVSTTALCWARLAAKRKRDPRTCSLPPSAAASDTPGFISLVLLE